MPEKVSHPVTIWLIMASRLSWLSASGLMVPSIDDRMWNDLLTWRDMWFGYLSLSTKAVVAGLVAEGPELFWETGMMIRRWLFKKRFHFSLPEEHVPNLVKVIAFVGWFFIVAGVAGEWVSEIKVADADASIESFITANLTDAKNETARAIAFAGLNELEAAQLDKKSAQLKKDAEAEHLARVKIEARVAWRRLTDKDKADLASELGKFPPYSEGASFWYTAGDIEAETFAVDLAEAIKLTQAVVQPPGDIMMLHESGKFGSPIKRPDFGVSVLSTKDEVSRGFANRLIKELNAKGFDCSIN